MILPCRRQHFFWKYFPIDEGPILEFIVLPWFCLEHGVQIRAVDLQSGNRGDCHICDMAFEEDGETSSILQCELVALHSEFFPQGSLHPPASNFLRPSRKVSRIDLFPNGTGPSTSIVCDSLATLRQEDFFIGRRDNQMKAEAIW